MNSTPDIKALQKKTQARVKTHKKRRRYRLGVCFGAGIVWLWGIFQHDKFIQIMSVSALMGMALWAVLETTLFSRKDRALWEEVAQVEGVMFVPLVLDLLVSHATPPKSLEESGLMERWFDTLKQIKPTHAHLFTNQHLEYVNGYFLEADITTNLEDIKYTREVIYFISQVGNERSYRVLRDFADNTSDSPELQELFAYAKQCLKSVQENYEQRTHKFILLRPSEEPNLDDELLRAVAPEETPK
jgi:hypothetical protein